MGDDVTRAEIYQVVAELRGMVAYGLRVVYVLAGLIVLQIAVKVWETARVMRMGRRVERQLDMAAAHGRVTDAQKERMDRTLAGAAVVLDRVAVVLEKVAATADKAEESAQHVTHAVDEVPHKTADLVVHKLSEHGDASSTSLPATRPPPGADPESVVP